MARKGAPSQPLLVRAVCPCGHCCVVEPDLLKLWGWRLSPTTQQGRFFLIFQSFPPGGGLLLLSPCDPSRAAAGVSSLLAPPSHSSPQQRRAESCYLALSSPNPSLTVLNAWVFPNWTPSFGSTELARLGQMVLPCQTAAPPRGWAAVGSASVLPQRGPEQGACCRPTLASERDRGARSARQSISARAL